MLGLLLTHEALIVCGLIKPGQYWEALKKFILLEISICYAIVTIVQVGQVNG